MSDAGEVQEDLPYRSKPSGFFVQFERAVNPDKASMQFTYEWHVVHAPCGVGFEESPIAFALGAVADGSYPNIPDSNTMLARTFNTPLTHASSYCGMVTACSVATWEEPTRCLNATTSTVLIDATPPVLVVDAPQIQAEGGGSNISVRVRVSVSDAESGVDRAWLSLGTSLDNSRYLYEVPFGNVSDTEGVVFEADWTNFTGFEGVIEFDPAFFEEVVPEGTLIYIFLTAANGIEQWTSFITIPIIYDSLPPLIGEIDLPGYYWSQDEIVWLGLMHPNDAPLKLTVAWAPAVDEGQGLDRYELCVGLELGNCSLSQQVLNGARITSEVTLLPNEADALALLKSSRRLFIF